MTRESKLALIIGFVLVLLVGVLVSDHFSQASSMDLDTRGGLERSVEKPITQLGEREQAAIDLAVGQNDRIADRPNDRTLEQGSDRLASNGNQQGSPVIISNGSDRSSIIDQAFEEARRIANRTNLTPVAQPSKDRGEQVVRDLPEQTYRSYTVVSGDSLIKIARRLLGDGERWLEIESLNADKLGPDSILQIGMTLKLPSDARMLTSSAGTNNRDSRNTSGEVRSYTVVSGDTLGEISMRLLGTSKRMDEIVQLNGLDSPDQIFIGMSLKIPAH